MTDSEIQSGARIRFRKRTEANNVITLAGYTIEKNATGTILRDASDDVTIAMDAPQAPKKGVRVARSSVKTHAELLAPSPAPGLARSGRTAAAAATGVSFQGAAAPLSADGLAEVLEALRVPAPELWAVLNVETRGYGFLPDRRPFILYERHVFSRETKRKFDATDPDISNKEPGGYGHGGAHQYDRLQRAVTLDETAALRSTSWGIGQLMGFNAKLAGYDTVQAMVADMLQSEDLQLKGMAGEIRKNGLDTPLRTHNWADFARGYNGKNYAINSYDQRLSAAYQKFVIGPLPDITIRTAQIYLLYLGYDPRGVDGQLGRFTRSALNDFQMDNGLRITTTIGQEEVKALKEAVDKLPK